MDLLGEIVERETATPQAPVQTTPQLRTVKPSKWRQRLQQKGISSMSDAVVASTPKDDGKFYQRNAMGMNELKDKSERKLDYAGLTESQGVHQENIEILSRMSLEERESYKEELINTFDPKILQLLMKRSMRKYADNTADSSNDQQEEIVEGSGGTWVGEQPPEPTHVETQTDVNRKPTKVKFDMKPKVVKVNPTAETKLPSDDEAETHTHAHAHPNESTSLPVIDDVEDTDTGTAPLHPTTPLPSSFHFPTPPQPYTKISVDDPNFQTQLHDLYFPTLPADPPSLSWMKPAPPAPTTIEYESLVEVRFDFQGDIITSESLNELSESGKDEGLYNHAENPEIPGYTLPELGRLLRSTVPGQVCLSARTLGRILYKLGTLKYQVTEVLDDDTEKKIAEGEEGEFEKEMWQLVNELSIIPLLEHHSGAKNLSAKNYAIDALWLWKQGNGDVKLKKYTQENNKS
ncbi:Rba50 protein [Martiniozyma asiatica (nom. inval.)]|nr:Rba50 protein [Martiniozyma asiatica]